MFRFLFTTILVRFAEAILYEVHGDGTVEFFEDTDNASDKTYMQGKRRRRPSFDDVDGDSGSFSSSKDSDESQKEVEVEQKTYSPTQFLREYTMKRRNLRQTLYSVSTMPTTAPVATVSR